MKRRATAGYGTGLRYSLAGIKNAGYTIVEVMIVLAVTGGLLISAVIMLGGKQIQTQATESVRAFDSSLEAMSREVASGRYNSNLPCQAPLSGPVLPNGTSVPGGNTGCIFIGKVLNMTPTGGVYINLVGRQFKDGTITDDVKNIDEAQPVKVTGDVSNIEYPYSLQVVRMFGTGTSQDYRALAFVVEFGGGSSIANNPVNGSRGIHLYGIRGSVNGNTTGVTVDVGSGSMERVPNGLTICLKTLNNKLAEITVGNGGNQYTTNVLIDNGVEDVCRY